MKSFGDIAQTYKIERPKASLRGNLIKQFMIEINRERLENKLPWIAVSRKVQHLNYDSLETFYKMCLEYRSRGKTFSKCFFGALRMR